MRHLELKAYHDDFGTIDIKDIDFGEELIRLDNGDLYSFDEIIIFQYTGMIDKNGRKLFEGDFYKSPEGKVDEINYSVSHGGYIHSFEPLTSDRGVLKGEIVSIER